MEPQIVPISKFKATCLALLKKIQKTGETIIVTRKGEPVAMVGPPPEPAMPDHWVGSFRSSGKILGDIVSPACDDEDWEVLDK